MSTTNINCAGVTLLLNRLGSMGFYAHAKQVSETNRYGEEYIAGSKTNVEVGLAYADFMPIIRLEADCSEGRVWIHTADGTTEVSSFFDNGSGPYLRNTEGSEFIGIQRDGYVHVYNSGAPANPKFPTPAGEMEALRQNEIDALRAEIAALKPKVVNNAPRV